MSLRILLALTCAQSLAFTTMAQAAEPPLRPQWLMPDQVLYQDDFSKPIEIAKLYEAISTTLNAAATGGHPQAQAEAVA